MAAMATASTGLRVPWSHSVPSRRHSLRITASAPTCARFVASRVTRLRTAAKSAAAAKSKDDAQDYEFDFEDDGSYDDDDEDGGWTEDGELTVAELNAINDARSDENANDTYFDSYAHIGIHREMIGDEARTGAYLKAIEGHSEFLKGKVVLDVGCGTGILSMFAARAGAKKVYAVDASGITRHAKRLVTENGFEDKIEIVKARMEQVTVEDIPEKVDVIVSEWMGYALFFESMLPSVVDARDRFLAKDGLVLPNVSDVRVALLSDQKRYDDGIKFWTDVYGFDFSSLQAQTKRDWSTDPPVATVNSDCIVSRPEGELVVSVDCASVPLADLYQPMSGEVVLEVVSDKETTVHGLCLWFDVDFYGKSTLSTSPFENKTHWYQTVLMFDDCLEMNAGDKIVASIELEPGSDPGAKRQLNIYANYDIVRSGDDVDTEKNRDDREFFNQWTVQ